MSMPKKLYSAKIVIEGDGYVDVLAELTKEQIELLQWLSRAVEREAKSHMSPSVELEVLGELH